MTTIENYLQARERVKNNYQLAKENRADGKLDAYQSEFVRDIKDTVDNTLRMKRHGLTSKQDAFLERCATHPAHPHGLAAFQAQVANALTEFRVPDPRGRAFAANKRRAARMREAHKLARHGGRPALRAALSDSVARGRAG